MNSASNDASAVRLYISNVGTQLQLPITKPLQQSKSHNNSHYGVAPSRAMSPIFYASQRRPRLHNRRKTHLFTQCQQKVTNLCTKPSRRLCNTWALYLISFTSWGVLSAHWPLVIGLSNILQNSVRDPRKSGRTKSTIHQYSIRLFWSGYPVSTTRLLQTHRHQ